MGYATLLVLDIAAEYKHLKSGPMVHTLSLVTRLPKAFVRNLERDYQGRLMEQ